MDWTIGWRDRVWAALDQPWDLVVIGGGITGAGILREGVRLGLRGLLVEQHDFAYGTSSRSSKLVHGGLRYLKQGRVGLTLASVRERQQLLNEGAGLIKPLGFLIATYRSDKMGRWVYRAGLSLYDLLALQWSHRYYDPDSFRMLAPNLIDIGLKGGFRYGDAQTDDARLVMRVIQEGVEAGGTALNYCAATTLLHDEAGQVNGVRLRDVVADREANVYGRVIVNATGAWADDLRAQVGAAPRLRPLRGSHLLFPNWRLPVAQAISFSHPYDDRPVFLYPWEGATLVGTTDVDHERGLDEEPRISPDEVAYLMAAVEAHFPSLELDLDDIVATFAGVRPVVDTGKADPSKESRDHVVWAENGLLTTTGGKLTTFQVIAHDALRAAADDLPELSPLNPDVPALDPVDIALPAAANRLDPAARARLVGRYGTAAPAVVAAAEPEELARVAGTETLWAELRWAARAEGVVHLDDLLLRRTRLGLLLPGGGRAELARIRAICQPELGWDDGRWAEEEANYLALWQAAYGVPDAGAVPDWRPRLAEALDRRAAASAAYGRRRTLPLAGFLLALAGVLSWFYWRDRRP